MEPPVLTFVLMDPPFEDARSTTALRLIGAALRRGCAVNVFAYEGAVALAQRDQRGHPGTEPVGHALPHRWVVALLQEAAARGLTVDWVHCTPCVDERGADDAVPGVRLGGPADLKAFVERSANTLVIPTK